MKCIGPKAKDADLWILIWEVVRRIRQEGTFVEVEHGKAHCSEKEKHEMTLFERFVAKGKGRTSWQQMEQCWMEETWRRSGASTVQQRREEVYAALQYAASLHC